MRSCDDCIYKNNCEDYLNAINTTPIDLDFFGCSGYVTLDNVFKSLEVLSKIKELFINANDADDFYHNVRVLFEGE